MSVLPNTFIEPFDTNVKDIWSVPTSAAVDQIHKDLYMKLSKQAEEIAALKRALVEVTVEQAEIDHDMKMDAAQAKLDQEEVKKGWEDVYALKVEIETLKNRLESLFNKGFILRNKNTKTLMRVATNPACNHYDIVANRLSCGIEMEYTPPSRPADNGGKGTENTIWILECI